MKTLSIEQLAEKLNASLWVKGDLKRIYLNEEGYNTKKMTTKTYVYQKEDGIFVVSCYVDCPSQPWQWRKSQEDEVKEWVNKKIENIIAQENLILVDYRELEETVGMMVYVKENEEAEPVWFTEENFYDKFGAYPSEVFSGNLELQND